MMFHQLYDQSFQNILTDTELSFVNTVAKKNDFQVSEEQNFCFPSKFRNRDQNMVFSAINILKGCDVSIQRNEEMKTVTADIQIGPHVHFVVSSSDNEDFIEYAPIKVDVNLTPEDCILLTELEIPKEDLEFLITRFMSYIN